MATSLLNPNVPAENYFNPYNTSGLQVVGTPADANGLSYRTDVPVNVQQWMQGGATGGTTMGGATTQRTLSGGSLQPAVDPNVLQANTINQVYDSRTSRLRSLLDRQPTMQDQALNSYNANYDNALGTLRNSFATGQENLGFQEQQNANSKQKSYRDIASGIRNMLESGANRLGAMNASDSSAAPMLQYALANLQARQRGDANDNFNTNQTQIGLARNNMQREFENQMNSLNTEKRNRIQEIADQFAQIRQGIVDEIAQSDEARAYELANLGKQYTMKTLADIQSLENDYNSRANQWLQQAQSSIPQVNTTPFSQQAQYNDYGAYGRGTAIQGGQQPSYEDVLAASPLRRIKDSQSF